MFIPKRTKNSAFRLFWIMLTASQARQGGDFEAVKQVDDQFETSTGRGLEGLNECRSTGQTGRASHR